MSERPAASAVPQNVRKADIADRVASRYGSRFLRGYARSKLRRDPLYAAVAQRLAGHEEPLVDVGCGIGLMALYLRAQGHDAPIFGIDHDATKIGAARAAAAGEARLEFREGDAREPLPSGSVLLLDLLHYFDDATQMTIASNVAQSVPAGGMVIVRDAIRDGTWRYRATVAAEQFARAIGWLKAERINFPSRERLLAAFAGFSAEAVPLWGRTPFNNYLFVFTRPDE